MEYFCNAVAPAELPSPADMDQAVSPNTTAQNAAADAPSPRPDRRRRLLIGAAVILIGGAIWGFRWWTVGRFIQDTDDAYLQADNMTVAPKVSGYVAEVYVTDNQAVSAGQPLVRLDNRQYEAMLEQAKAAIAARKADIERGEAELLQHEATIAQARAQVLGSRAAEAHAIAEVKRYEPLIATGAESSEKLADLLNAKHQASAKLAADIAAQQAAERQPATTRAQIDQARAQLQAAEASTRQSQLDLGDTIVRSTLAGRVGDRAVRVGQFVQPGTRLMTIVPVQDIYLTANFKETQIGRMRSGQPATIQVDALPGQEIHGTVESFSPGTGAQFALLPPQNATGNFTKIVQRVPVRIRLNASEQTRQRLLPGLSVTVHVDTREKAGADSRTAFDRSGQFLTPNVPKLPERISCSRTAVHSGSGKEYLFLPDVRGSETAPWLKRPSAAEPNASVTDWIAVIGGALGALMATLDISITNSALPQIQGSIGATGTEGTWISTGYLMSEIVMIPLAAWLTRVFGLRSFLLTNTILFTLFSVVCGISHTLPEMIIGRIGQGFTGGAMIPTAQTIVRTRLPRHQMPIGMTLFGLIVLLGPLLGPVLGGWLAENIHWSWCFFVNLPVGLALMLLLVCGIAQEPSRLASVRERGLAGHRGPCGGIELAHRGARERAARRTGSTRAGSPGSVCSRWSGIGTLIAGQFFVAKPVVRLKLLANKSYASVILIVFTIGAGLYGVSFLLPQFLSGVSGYNAEQSGAIMLVSGLPAFLIMPLLPRMLGKFDARAMVIAGLLCFAVSCLLDISLTAQSVGHDFYSSQLLRGVGQMLAMMPLNQASMSAVSREEAGDAAGLYNMARNLGGSVGLALLGVVHRPTQRLS